MKSRCITYYIHYIYIHIDMTAPYIVLELPCSGGAVPDDADALGDATAVDGIAAGRVELRSGWGSRPGLMAHNYI